MKRSNCFLFAFSLWLKWRKQGSYFAVRNTRHLVGLHWIVQHPKYKRWLGYEPYIYYGSWWKEAIAKLWYKGRIIRDDKPRRINMFNIKLSFVVTKEGKDFHNTVLEYSNMDEEQMCEFQSDLIEALGEMQKKWREKKFKRGK